MFQERGCLGACPGTCAGACRFHQSLCVATFVSTPVAYPRGVPLLPPCRLKQHGQGLHVCWGACPRLLPVRPRPDLYTYTTPAGRDTCHRLQPNL